MYWQFASCVSTNPLPLVTNFIVLITSACLRDKSGVVDKSFSIMFLPEWQLGGGGQKYIMDYIVCLRICFLLIHILKDESYGLHRCVPLVIN